MLSSFYFREMKDLCWRCQIIAEKRQNHNSNTGLCDYKVHAGYAIGVPVHRYSWYEVKASHKSCLPHHLLELCFDLLPHLLLRAPTNCFYLEIARTTPTSFFVESWSGAALTNWSSPLPSINQSSEMSSQPTSTDSSSNVSRLLWWSPLRILTRSMVNQKF